jgi:hypothetical protein
MSDAHLRILRAAAKTRARQLQDDDGSPQETPEAAHHRRGEQQRLAVRARQQLTRASERRRHADS